MSPVLDHPLAQALAWSLLHFLWQGALLGLAARAGFRLLRDRGPQARYLLGCAVLVAMALAPLATFLGLRPAAGAEAMVDLAAAPALAAAGPARPWAADLGRSLRPLLPWAVALWLAGVTVLGLRLVGGWIWLLRLRTRLAEPAGACWQLTVNTLARRMKVRAEVRILRSWSVDTPMVVGWLKPLVLVPAAALAHMAPEALEAVLAHELAHVRRHDYLVNLLQSALEVLLFYHPAVWWLSAQVRQERELCCDDAAVALCGDPHLYARALATLEALRGDPALDTHLAPAAHGGSLMSRIQRLLSPTLPPSPTRRAGVLAALAVTALGAGTALRLQEPPKAPVPPPPAAERTTRIVTKDDQGRVSVTTRGEVKVRPAAGTDLSLGEGASLEIAATGKDGARTFKASREKGAEVRTYTVDGKLAAVDQAWLDARLDQIKSMEGRTFEARAKAEAEGGKAGTKRIEVRVHSTGADGGETVTTEVHPRARAHAEVHVLRLDKDGKVLTEDLKTEGGRRVIIKRLDSKETVTEGLEAEGGKRVIVKRIAGPDGKETVTEEVTGEGGKRVIVKRIAGLDGKDGAPGRVVILKGDNSGTVEVDVDRITKDALGHLEDLKGHGMDLERLREHLHELKVEGGPKVLRFETRHGKEGLAPKEEMEALRREMERLQRRMDKLQQRMQGEVPPPPPPPPPAPKAPKAPKAAPAPAAPPAPPAPPAKAPGAAI